MRPTAAPLSLRDAAHFLGMNFWTLRDAVHAGHLPVLRLGHRTVRIAPKALAAFAARRAAEAKRRGVGLPCAAVAARLGTSVAVVRARIRAGEIRPTSSGSGGYRVSEAELSRYLKTVAR